ncbi:MULTISPECIES: cytoplasmic protein [unclassified Modicisalibacter]|uniref:cytoplasmic protein n=1 Tax=unclassified Modicisalibacter TaxID=2679913 RepID=UPI001CCD4C5F|nr:MULTISPECIES: cytoplasmic protein [unclassified Modicisalibacter]MBZ9556514.1 cytoplasmic protein [Modicisalibacter sp. R2A 31.J]MBZ9575017.1 cytoplasmic protein [Modicisalibacter sp. MOD 31.J]
MSMYRLVVRRHGRLLGHFDTDVPGAFAVVQEIAELLAGGESIELALLAAEDERRWLETGPDGMRVIGREPIFRTLS